MMRMFRTFVDSSLDNLVSCLGKHDEVQVKYRDLFDVKGIFLFVYHRPADSRGRDPIACFSFDTKSEAEEAEVICQTVLERKQ